MSNSDLRGHIVICGWGEKAFRVVRQLHAPVIRDKKPILLVAKEVGNLPDEPAFEGVYALQGDCTRDETLRDAAVEHADSAIILSDPASGATTDARSILIAIAIESINRHVHTAVEVADSTNLPHFARTGINEAVSLDHLSEKLLAQAALNHGATDFYQELLLFQVDGNELYRVPLPSSQVGRTVGRLYNTLLPRRIVVVGVHRDGQAVVNPFPDYELRKSDDLWVIAFQMPGPEDLS